jgi:choline transport protein
MGRSQQLVRTFARSPWHPPLRLLQQLRIDLFGISPSLTDGGWPALVYSVIWNFIGFSPIYLSMTEMASTALIAGAQYHWVSEFALESLQKILSYFTGYA